MERDAVDDIVDQWAREQPDMQVGSIDVVARILRIAKLITDERRRTLASLGTDVATLDLLATLRRSGPPYRMSPSEIGRNCLVSGGAVTQRVARAEAAGLVEVARTDSGRRTVTVELTPKGHQCTERNISALIGRERDLIADLGDQERERLVELLRELLASVEHVQQRAEGGRA
jgi:DNA-binding MarR family transcriptional regulator